MTDHEWIEIPPDVQGTLAAKRAERMRWRDVLGELIDNSFDAGASLVEITINGKELRVSDDGVGCDDFEKMLTLGKHTHQRTTRLGRFGVGLKDAAWWVGGPTRIVSVCNGLERRVRVSWDEMRHWRVPRHAGEVTDHRPGTVITFEKIGIPGMDRRIPEGKDFDDLVAYLGFIYSPALRRGCRISFARGKRLFQAERYEMPAMEDVVDTSALVDGKRIRVHVGIVPEGVRNPHPGINYAHGFRVIIPETELGCGDYSSDRIAGWVLLEDDKDDRVNGWKLTRNKDDISDYKEQLGEAVFGLIEPVLKKASKQALLAESSLLSRNLTDMFRGLAAGDPQKEKRERGEGGVRVEPKGTERKRRNFSKTQPGGNGGGTPAGKFKIVFRELDEGKIGKVDLEGGVIQLADSHPFISAAKKAGNREALLGVAVMLFASRDCNGSQSLLPCVRDGSVAREIEYLAGKLLADWKDGGVRIVDGKKAA